LAQFGADVVQLLAVVVQMTLVAAVLRLTGCNLVQTAMAAMFACQRRRLELFASESMIPVVLAVTVELAQAEFAAPVVGVAAGLPQELAPVAAGVIEEVVAGY